MNTYEMLEELRSNLGETVAAHWTEKTLLKKLSAQSRRTAGRLMMAEGDWLMKHSTLTPSSGVITLPVDCAKPIYMEDASTGQPLPLNITVRERQWTRPPVSGLDPGQLDAYMEGDTIVINDSTVTGNITLWYQQRIWDLIAGTADTGSAASTIVIPVANGPRYIDDYYIGAYVEVVGGVGVGTRAAITDYVGSTRTLTVAGTFDNTSVFGTVPQVPEEGHDLIILGATMQAMAKPSSDIEQEVFKYYTNLYAEAKAQFDDWAATRKSGSTHVRRTEID